MDRGIAEVLPHEEEETSIPELVSCDEEGPPNVAAHRNPGNVYPPDSKAFMNTIQPPDSRFIVPDGQLIVLERRDERFPYIYRLKTHPHPLLPPVVVEHIKETWVHIVDPSPEAQRRRFEFEKNLTIPIGPDDLMPQLGS